ncbi:NADH-quinone oxidoreductase subunit B family protein [Persephonella sp.]
MKIGVFKFASCDGCQLAFFEISPVLLNLPVEINYFIEAQSENTYGEFDVSFIEGSISTQEHIQKIKEIREKSKKVVTIGACANSGGIQSIRNFMDFKEVAGYVYPFPDWIDSLPMSYPVDEFIEVDFHIPGCPIIARMLLDTITALLIDSTPKVPEYPVCMECKRAGNPCLLILGKPCLGPITRAGCGALCPSHNAGCYGCFGPVDSPNLESLSGILEKNYGIDLIQMIKTGFNGYNPAFRGKYERD